MAGPLAKVKCFDDSGKPVSLGKLLGEGGEGKVFDLANNPEAVAKVYHKVETSKGLKLEVMCRLQTPDLLKVTAWPIQTLRDAPRGRVVGFVQPRASGREVHDLYGFRSREQFFGSADWGFLVHTAMNLAGAFETIHSHGHAIGDVNSKNIWVAANGTVSLVDCDSFHVYDSGRTFPCEVGVDLYTPPELQGRPFTGIERTVNHDCFGLAVVIFQLLLVGRHPYIGVFHGQGDMPMEKAIKEHRFAFGKNARQFQMEPPPFSPTLAWVAPEIAGLFETAFDPKSANGSARPPASAWHAALKSQAQQTKACTRDRGHRYHSGLKDCPWCDLIRRGGPNYFRSVAVASMGAAVAVARFRVDFTGIDTAMHRLESMPIPSLHFVRPPAPPQTPLPFDAGIETNRVTRRFLGKLAVVSSVLGVLSLLLLAVEPTAALVLFLGLGGLTAAFTVWIMILLWTDPFAAERQRRRLVAAQKQREYETSLRERAALHSRFSGNFDRIQSHLRDSKSQLDGLQREYDSEYAELEAHNRQAQMDTFLDTFLITQAKIPGIGKGKITILASFGVETALDIVEGKILSIHGFGPKRTADLLAWRHSIERQFKFDPAKRISPQRLQALNSKYLVRQKDIRDAILHGVETTSGLCRQWQEAVSQMDTRLKQQSDEWYAAESDATFKSELAN